MKLTNKQIKEHLITKINNTLVNTGLDYIEYTVSNSHNTEVLITVVEIDVEPIEDNVDKTPSIQGFRLHNTIVKRHLLVLMQNAVHSVMILGVEYIISVIETGVTVEFIHNDTVAEVTPVKVTINNK